MICCFDRSLKLEVRIDVRYSIPFLSPSPDMMKDIENGSRDGRMRERSGKAVSFFGVSDDN